MNWEVFKDEEGQISVANVLKVVVASPVLEEAIFRVILLSILLRRSDHVLHGFVFV